MAMTNAYEYGFRSNPDKFRSIDGPRSTQAVFIVRNGSSGLMLGSAHHGGECCVSNVPIFYNGCANDALSVSNDVLSMSNVLSLWKPEI